MTEQEIIEEAGILDKACRRCGTELEQGGIAVLLLHAAAINVMTAKLLRLDAAKQALPDADKVA